LSNIAVGLGWALTDSVVTKLIPLWLGAKGQEFSYEYLQTALDSNVLLVFYIAVATLVSLPRKNSSSPNSNSSQILPLVQAGLLFYLALRPVLNYLQTNKTALPLPLGWDSTDTVFKLVWTVILGTLAVRLYRIPQSSQYK